MWARLPTRAWHVCLGFLTGEPLGPGFSVPGRLGAPRDTDSRLITAPQTAPCPKHPNTGPASEQLPRHQGPKRMSKTAACCRNEEH